MNYPFGDISYIHKHLDQYNVPILTNTWWRQEMETFSALLALCAGNSPVTRGFPAQRPVTRSFDVFLNLRLNRQLSKRWRRWGFETLPCLLWRHCNETLFLQVTIHDRLRGYKYEFVCNCWIPDDTTDYYYKSFSNTGIHMYPSTPISPSSDRRISWANVFITEERVPIYFTPRNAVDWN